MTLSPKTTKILILLVVVAVAGILSFNLSRIFKGVPFFAPPPPAAKEPKTIGLIYFRQQNEAIAGVKDGLKELGYENIIYEEKKVVPGPTMVEDAERAARELMPKKVDLIVTGLEFQAKGALKATKDMQSNIPIVFLTQFHDPVKYGLAESFTSSGNNSTGVALNIVEVVQKQLEFVRKINPAIKKIGVFTNGFMVPDLSDEFFPEFKLQAKRFDYEVVEYTTTAPPPEAEKAWHQVAAGIKPGEIDAIYHLAGHFYEPQEVEETKLAARLGALHIAPLEDLPTGGHLGYAADFTAAGKQASRLVDKIFNGEKPENIPLEFAREHVLTIYLERARQAGIEFPDEILSIAKIQMAD